MKCGYIKQMQIALWLLLGYDVAVITPGPGDKLRGVDSGYVYIDEAVNYDDVLQQEIKQN